MTNAAVGMCAPPTVNAGAKLTGSAGFPLIVMIASTVGAKMGDALSSRALACPERSRMGGISVPSQSLSSRALACPERSRIGGISVPGKVCHPELVEGSQSPARVCHPELVEGSQSRAQTEIPFCHPEPVEEPAQSLPKGSQS